MICSLVTVNVVLRVALVVAGAVVVANNDEKPWFCKN